MMDKQIRSQYTLEYKLEAVRQVKAGQSITVTAQVLGIAKTTLRAWVDAHDKGKLEGAGDKPTVVTPEQMELARMRAQISRLKMELEIAKKPRRTLRRMFCKVRLDQANEEGLSGKHLMCSSGGECERLF
jgi:transposase